MAKVKISDFSSTPGNNTEIDNINISEGCAPSGINDAIRELMAQLKDFQTGAAGDSFNGPVGTTTAAAGAFTTLSASGAVTLSGGTANGVAYLNGSKVLTTGSALTFDGTNLGVGALNTNALLTLSGDKTAVRVERGSAIGFAYNTGTAATDSFRIQSNAGPVDIYTASGQPITFSAGATEQMRLTSTGLGIGTSSPGQKLDVTGNIGTTGTLINTATSGEITKSTGATTGNIYHRITNTGGSTLVGNESSAGGTLMVGSSAYSGLINVTGAYPLAFGTNNTERMRLDSSGNLGLGVTPSAWASWYRSLDMLGGGSFASSDAAFLSVMTHNAFYNGSNNIYKANGGASQYIQGSGSHLWFTAPSGTAGNAISFSQSMTLDASGRLGIGTTSPNSTLSVNGNILAPWANSGTYEIGVEQRTTNVFSTTTNVFVVRGADAVFGNDAMGGGSVLIRGGKGYGTAGGPAGDVVIQGGEALSGYVANPGNIIFKTGQTTAERARIDSSGNLLVGTTTQLQSGSERLSVNGPGTFEGTGSTTVHRIFVHNAAGSGQTSPMIRFSTSNGTAGEITSTSTSTSYVTSSDYRLKNITGPITTSGAYIDSLNPVEGTWKADGSAFVGLIAHEVQEASRTNVATGVKDGEEMQGMDYSSAEIIANLIAEVKALRTRVAALESI